MCAWYHKRQPGGEFPGEAAFMNFLEEFKEESDRAAVILGIARLDMQLMQLLSKVLVPSTANTDELLEGDAPLGAFSSRIHAAYRLGLINGELARSLHLCRRIRNSFAHDSVGTSLAGGAHRDRVRELMRPLEGVDEFKHFRATHFEEGGDDFRSALAWVSLRLEGALEDARPLSAEDAWQLID